MTDRLDQPDSHAATDRFPARTQPLALAGVACSMLLAAGAARAAVLNIADGDVAGLIAAIDTANGNGEADVINLAAGGSYVLLNDVGGGNGLPHVTSAITINGNGATIQRDAGAAPFRIFEASNASLALNDLTVSGGDAGAGIGGGILNNFGTLVMANCTVSGNSAGNGGGA